MDVANDGEQVLVARVGKAVQRGRSGYAKQKSRRARASRRMGLRTSVSESAIPIRCALKRHPGLFNVKHTYR